MHLTLADLADLPLAGALVGPDGAVIAHTPEWDGPGPGAVAYAVRANRLVVRTEPASQHCDEVLDRLLAALDRAAGGAGGVDGLRMRMLAASLRLVAGRDAPGEGDTARVLALARAGITARTALVVRTVHEEPAQIRAPEVAALVLVQLAVNAERHERARQVVVGSRGTVFSVSWRSSNKPGRAATSRRRAERARWGLGFARIAADAIGATVYPPRDRGDGTAAATLEMGLRRLALPLAMVRDNRVVRATYAWNEETGLAPGAAAATGTRLGGLVSAARANAGALTMADGWSARSAPGGVWVAVAPDDADARARDVIAGLAHERALSTALTEPERSTVGALALLLATLLGERMPRVPMAAWRRRMDELAAAFGLQEPLPDFDGAGAIDPQVVAYLAASAGDGFEADGDRLWLRVRPKCRDDAAVRVLLRPGEDRIPLG